ncbi:MAG: hypothetical protein Kow0074_17560 [Candidatus Zixiibacteriota bacterium]
MINGRPASVNLKRVPMRGIIALLLGMFLLTGSGCVYFNTFYHAKKFYGQGETLRKKARGQSAIGPGKTHYLDAIEKANKVVEKYPNSKYHDDALFIIGMSYFHIQNFTKSEAAFRELLVTHPDSKFIEEARLYLARCRIQLGDEQAGFRVFTELAETARKDEWRAEAIYQRGKFFFDNESYDSAQVEFARVINEFPKSERAEESRLLAAQSLRKMGDADAAIALYRPLLKEKESPDLQLRAYRGIGEAFYESGRPDSGIAVFESLIEDERFQDSIGVIRLSLARGLKDIGDYEGAWRQYERVAAVMERTQYAAEAYFRMAEIKQYQEQDLVAAKELYDQSRVERSVGELANEALNRSANITRLEQFRLELGRGELRSPAQMGSLGKVDFEYDRAQMPRFERNLPYSPPEARPPYDSTRFEVPEDRQHLVQGPLPPTQEELEYMALLMPDTAVISETPLGPPTALAPFLGPPVDSAEMRFNLKRNVLLPYWSWVNLYGVENALGPPSPGYLYEFGLNGLFGPATPPDSVLAPIPVFAAVVDTAEERRRRELEAERDEKMAELEKISASASTQLQLAELYRFSLDSPDSALVEYQKMVESYPNSHYAAKALLGAADVLRDDLGDTAQAETYLRRILQEYPYTDYAGVAIERLGLKGTAADTAYPARVYEQAENAYLIDNNPREAIRKLEDFIIRYPESKLVPNAEWAIVALREQYFPSEDSTIYYAYQEIQAELAGTPFAEAANEKLTYVVERPQRKQRRVLNRDSLSLVQADTSTAGDSLGLEASLPLAPNPQYLPQRIKTTGDFLFPESEIGSYTQEMRVVYKILINFNGEVEHYEVLKETDSPDINEAARLAIENTVFNADSIPVDSLNMYYRYDLRIQPPARERDEFDQFGIDRNPTKN